MSREIDQEVWIKRNRSIGMDQEDLIKINRLRGMGKEVWSRSLGTVLEEWIKRSGSRRMDKKEGIKRNGSREWSKRNGSRKINKEECDRRGTDQEEQTNTIQLSNSFAPFKKIRFQDKESTSGLTQELSYADRVFLPVLHVSSKELHCAKVPCKGLREAATRMTHNR